MKDESISSLEFVGALSARLAHSLGNHLSILTGNLCVAKGSMDEPEKLSVALASALNGANEAGELLSRFADLRRSIQMDAPETPAATLAETASAWCAGRGWIFAALGVPRGTVQFAPAWLRFTLDVISGGQGGGAMQVSGSNHALRIRLAGPRKISIQWDEVRRSFSDFDLTAAYELLSRAGCKPVSRMITPDQVETVLSFPLLPE